MAPQSGFLEYEAANSPSTKSNRYNFSLKLPPHMKNGKNVKARCSIGFHTKETWEKFNNEGEQIVICRRQGRRSQRETILYIWELSLAVGAKSELMLENLGIHQQVVIF